MILSAYRPAYVDEFGKHEESKLEWEPPILLHHGCYIIYKNWFGRYQIKELGVASFWYTGICGWKLSNGWCFTSDEYGETIFKHDELQKAIEICEKKNRMRKIRVVRRR